MMMWCCSKDYNRRPPPPPCDPSSSSSSQLINNNINYEGDSSAHYCTDCDHNTEFSAANANFSIRDYVFAARSRGLSRSWPFSQEFMKVCMKYGVKELLPPFEPPTMISWKKRCTDDHHQADHVLVLCGDQVDAGYQQQHQSDLCSDQHHNINTSGTYNNSLKGNFHANVSSTTDRDQHPLKYRQISGGSKLEYSETKSSMLIVDGPNLSDNYHEMMMHGKAMEESGKKRDVIDVDDSDHGKFYCCNSVRRESSRPVSCDVTTTSNEKKHPNLQIRKQKMKAKKTRLMSDILAVARSCTLEDLDRINGTSWAADLGLKPYDHTAESLQGNAKNAADGRADYILASKMKNSDLLMQPLDNGFNSKLAENLPPKKRLFDNNSLDRNRWNRREDLFSLNQYKRNRPARQHKEGACGINVENKTQAIDAKGSPLSSLFQVNQRFYGSPPGETHKAGCLNGEIKSEKQPPLPKTDAHKSDKVTMADFSSVGALARAERKPRTMKKLRKVESLTSSKQTTKLAVSNSMTNILQSQVKGTTKQAPYQNLYSSISYSEGTASFECQVMRKPMSFMVTHTKNSDVGSTGYEMAPIVGQAGANVFSGSYMMPMPDENNALEQQSLTKIWSEVWKPSSPQEEFLAEVFKTKEPNTNTSFGVCCHSVCQLAVDPPVRLSTDANILSLANSNITSIQPLHCSTLSTKPMSDDSGCVIDVLKLE